MRTIPEKKHTIRIDGKRIGSFDPEINTFHKNVSKSKHLFKILNAWGIDSEYFNVVLLPRNAKIKVYDMEDGKTYTTTAKDWKEKGQYFHFKNKGVDHRTQIFLSLDKFSNEENSKVVQE